jgi:hypothetical protein
VGGNFIGDKLLGGLPHLALFVTEVLWGKDVGAESLGNQKLPAFADFSTHHAHLD